MNFLYKVLIIFIIVFMTLKLVGSDYQNSYIKGNSKKEYKVSGATLLSVIRKTITKRQFHKDNLTITIEGINSPIDSVDLILAMIYIESRFNPKAYNNSSGCSGLMQLEKDTYYYMLKKGFISKDRWSDIFNPYYNVYVSIVWFDCTYRTVKHYLPYLTTEEALLVSIAAYNKGVGNAIKEIKSNGGKPMPKYKYVELFKKAYITLKSLDK